MRRLLRSIDAPRAAWYGCAEHAEPMRKALEVGLPGVTSGGTWVDDRPLDV